MHCGVLVLEGRDAHAGKDGVKLVHFVGHFTCAYYFRRVAEDANISLAIFEAML